MEGEGLRRDPIRRTGGLRCYICGRHCNRVGVFSAEPVLVSDEQRPPAFLTRSSDHSCESLEPAIENECDSIEIHINSRELDLSELVLIKI